MNATITSFGSKGFGFCELEDGEKLFFHLRGNHGDNRGTPIEVSMVIEVHEIRESDHGADRVAWSWSLAETSTKVKYLWHKHGVVVADFGILPDGENHPLRFHVNGHCQFGDKDIRSPAGLLNSPPVGTAVVILNTWKKPTGETTAHKWCLVEEFPEHLCGDDFDRQSNHSDPPSNKGSYRILIDGKVAKIGTLDNILTLIRENCTGISRRGIPTISLGRSFVLQSKNGQSWEAISNKVLRPYFAEAANAA